MAFGRALQLALLSGLLVSLLLGANADLTESKLPPLLSEEEVKTESPTASSTTSFAEDKNVPKSTEIVEPVKPETTQTPVVVIESKSPADLDTSKQVAPSQANSGSSSNTQPERDLNVLLASKDDAENDLGGSPDGRRVDSRPPVLVVPQESSVNKQQVSLDSPVDVKQNDDRFHYSIGKNPPQEATTATKDAEPEMTGSTAQSAIVTTASSLIYMSKDEPRPESSQDLKPQLEFNSDDFPSKPSKTDTSDSVPATTISSTTSTTTTTTTTTTETPSKAPAPETTTTVLTAKGSAPNPAQPAVNFSSATKETEPTKTIGGPTKSIETTKKPEETSESSDRKTATTSTAKPIEKPSGSTLISSLVPLAAGLTSGKDKTNSIATTTSAPSLRATTSSRRPASSTDRWDKWNSSDKSASTGSTTVEPPAFNRRRPILPSIKRRFRPYNRFSPFPWGGAESYNPSGSEPDYLDEHGPRDSAPYGPKHRRTTTTTEPPREVSSKSPTSAHGDDSDTGPSLSRRRPIRRRTHSHGSPPTASEYPSDQEPERHIAGHHRHHWLGSQDEGVRSLRPRFGIDQSDSTLGLSPFGRPTNPNGFGGLFNIAGSNTGSGFDLLNPLTWLNDMNRPKPARQPSLTGPASRPPIAGGEYPPSPGRSQEPGYSGSNQDHAVNILVNEGRPNNGRDDYNHNCHNEHDYRPHRPHHDRDRDREPYRPRPGDYDSYSGRPNGRPYDRHEPESSSGSGHGNASGERDQGEGAESRPSSYGDSSPSGSSESRGENHGESLTSRTRFYRPSIISPFDTLFGGLEDDLFSMRPSFGERSTIDSARSWDTVISSPRISNTNLSGSRTVTEIQKRHERE